MHGFKPRAAAVVEACQRHHALPNETNGVTRQPLVCMAAQNYKKHSINDSTRWYSKEHNRHLKTDTRTMQSRKAKAGESLPACLPFRDWRRAATHIAWASALPCRSAHLSACRCGAWACFQQAVNRVLLVKMPNHAHELRRGRRVTAARSWCARKDNDNGSKKPCSCLCT